MSVVAAIYLIAGYALALLAAGWLGHFVIAALRYASLRGRDPEAAERYQAVLRARWHKEVKRKRYWWIPL